MKIIFSRYILPYIITMLGIIIAASAMTWWLDGWAVIISWGFALVMALMYLPYMLYDDYLTVKKYVSRAHTTYQIGEIKEDEWMPLAAKYASGVSGVPEFITEWAVARLGKLYQSTKKVKQNA